MAAKRFEDPIEVPPAVFEGLEAVQGSHETNMLDHQAVRLVASRRGYQETALWVDEHRDEYAEGVFRGFVAGGSCRKRELAESSTSHPK